MKAGDSTRCFYEALAYAAWRVMIPIALAIKIAATQTKSACAD